MSESAKVAANWWGDAVCGQARHDTGSADLNLYGILVAGRGPAPSATGRDLFVAALETKIEERLTKFGEVYLRVDYGPDGILHDVYCGLDSSVVAGFSFPPKTSMDVRVDGVTVSNGYRARNKRLCGEPKWRVTLYSADYDRFDPYHGTDEREARAAYEMGKAALAAFPKAKAILYCDGNDMGGDDR